jgi:hypothetical protein
MRNGDSEKQIELSLWKQGAIFLLAYLVVAARNPDAILHAQFWAEDGRIWFEDAYNRGWWPPLLHPHQGYFQTFPRLGASLALLVPLSSAPLVLNLIAIGARALPVNLLLSSRSSACGNLSFRALLAGMYLVLPNCQEISANITNSQWILALCVFLLLTASTPQSVAGRVFDISILLLSGLTGPFCIFLLPIALFFAWKRRDRWHWMLAGTLAALCFVEAWALLNGFSSIRPHYALGASPALFMRILGGRVFLATLVGANGLAAHLPGLWAAHPSLRVSVLLYGITIAGVVITAICFMKSAAEMRLFLLFSTMVFTVSLISPTAYPPPGVTVWELLAEAADCRYWFFPTLAFAWSLLWCIRSQPVPLKVGSACLLTVMCIGIHHDWRRGLVFEDLHFAEYVKRLEAAPVGATVIIPLNPKGWIMGDMQLVKRP